MKKVLPYILILMVAVGSFMAPFSAFLKDGKFDLKPNIAWADPSFSDITVTLSISTKPTAGSAILNVNFKTGTPQIYENLYDGGDNSGAFFVQVGTKEDLSDQKAKTRSGYNDSRVIYPEELKERDELTNINQSITIVGLDASQKYYARVLGITMPSKVGRSGGISVDSTNGNDAFDVKQLSAIGNKINFTTSPKGEGGEIATEGGSFNPEDNLPGCGLSGLFGGKENTLGGCILQIFYYAFWTPSSWLAGFAGKILDFFVFFSIDSASYSGSSFVSEGWAVVRDIANIAFIFVLLYIAIRTILNLGNDSKKMIVNVVIVALLINFSLFFTKVIVDSGNILAGVLYSDISSTQDGEVVTDVINGKPVKQVSAAIVSKFDPQRIMASSGVTKDTANDMKAPFLVIIVMATIVNIYMILTFLSVAFLFVGRVVGLMVSMIFSPFAFISLVIPGSGKIMKQWSWDKWFPELISMTFMAPIFIFFLWLILKFLDTGLVKGLVENSKNIDFSQAFKNIVTVLVPFILVLALLTKAKEVAKEMAGELATKISEYAGKAAGVVGGFVGGVALGGAGLLGRATIGRAAAGSLEGGAGEALRERAARGELGARLQLQAFEGLSKRSFDLRKTSAVEAAQKGLGINLATPGGRIPLTNIDFKTEGGFRGRTERETKRAAERSELFKVKGPEVATQDLKAKEWESKYNKDRDEAQQKAKSAGMAFKEADFRKLYESKEEHEVKDTAGNVVYSVKGESKVLNAAETNAKRMRNEADTIQYGKGYVEERDKEIEDTKKQAAKDIIAGKAPKDVAKFDEEKFKKERLEKQDPNYVKSRGEAEAKANRLGMTFNEKVWRQEEYFDKKLSRPEQETAADLRKKAGEEEKKEKPLSTRERNILAAKLDQANAKFNESVEILKKIADNNTAVTGGDVSKVTEDMVKSRVTDLKSREARFDTYVSVWQKRLRAAKKDSAEEAKALVNLTKANRNKAMVRDVIHHTENVIDTTNRTEENINDLNTKLS